MAFPRQRSFWPHALSPDSDPSHDTAPRRQSAAHRSPARCVGGQPDHHLTQHARARVRQRGLREGDVGLVLRHGTRTRDGVMLTNRDADAAIAVHRRAIAKLDRLRGTAVFLAGETVLSVYRPDRRKARRILGAALAVALALGSSGAAGA